MGRTSLKDGLRGERHSAVRPGKTDFVQSFRLVAFAILQRLGPVPGVYAMRTNEIRYTKTLVFYDGILLFEAKDPIGGTYLASHVKPVPKGDRYLLVGCRPEDLRMLRQGAIEPRSLMQESAEYGWFLADLTSTERPLDILDQGFESIPEKHLPGEGITIAEFEVDHETTRQARERDNVILQVSIEPPEAVGEYRVRTDTLTGLLTRVERLTRYAAERTAIEGANPRTRGRVSRNVGRLEIVGISHGSIKVTLQEARGLDTNRESLLAKALEQLDGLFNEQDTSNRAEAYLAAYDSRVANAYISLMKFLRARKTGFSYTWATPTSRHPSHRGISLERVRKIASELPEFVEDSDNETPADEIVLEGTLEMADEPANRWRLRDLEHGVREGTVAEDGPSLSNLVIDRWYRFLCSEEAELTGRRGRRKPALFLRHITPM